MTKKQKQAGPLSVSNPKGLKIEPLPNFPKTLTMVEQRRKEKAEIENRITHYFKNKIPQMKFLNWCFQVISYLDKVDHEDATWVLCNIAEAIIGTTSDKNCLISITQFDKETFTKAVKDAANSYFNFWCNGSWDTFDIEEYSKFSQMLQVFMTMGNLHNDYYWANRRVEYEEEKAA